jgi:hypothetical protein
MPPFPIFRTPRRLEEKEEKYEEVEEEEEEVEVNWRRRGGATNAVTTVNAAAIWREREARLAIGFRPQRIEISWKKLQKTLRDGTQK